MSILDRSFALGAANFQIEVLKAEIEEFKQKNTEMRQVIDDLHQLVAIRRELVPINQYHPNVKALENRIEELKKENQELKKGNNKHIQVIMELKRNNDLNMDIVKKFLPPEEEPSNTTPSEEKQCRFKVGDRVSFFLHEKLKGTVMAIGKCECVLQVKPDNPFYLVCFPKISECKRLVKVKKVNCGNCSGMGWGLDLIGSRAWDCQNCNGTGVVKEKISSDRLQAWMIS